ncbi:MAG: hypothetical protein JHC95_04680 [Solirubrobacteraceae bacterium]|nr:hypothetical protein [Solirubrobacteraceae bacterium]
MGSPPRQAFTEFSSGLRLIATAPATTETSPDGAIETLLDQAREVHGLVVVDCGTYWLADPTPLACADRVVWTMTATDVGFAAAGALLASGAVPRPPVGGEALVARHIPAVAGAKVRALRRLARDRRGRLVLMAHDNGGATQDPPCEVVLRALSGIAPTLRAGTR